MDCRSLTRVRFLVVVVASCFCTLLSGGAAQQNGDVRLVNGVLVNEGRVEVYYDGQWGTVCDDSWNTVDADVICKQLGFVSAEQIFYRAEYGQGSGEIWIDQINCPSGVESILNCSHNGWGSHDCRHSEDAGVKCKRLQPTKPSEMPVRLSCPGYNQDGSCNACSNKKYPSPGECAPVVTVQGIVEAFYNDEWKPVSLDGWNFNSAKVVCNQLGYPEAYGSPSLTKIWTNWDGLHCSTNGSSAGVSNETCSVEERQENDEFRNKLSSTWLKKLDCTGAEGQLLNCYFREFGPIDNPTRQVATVRCGFKPHSRCFAEGAFKETYRTRAGAVPWAGRLEVNVNGEWGTVCDSDFDMKEANIVCRAMGYGSAKSFQVRASYGKGVGKIHYSNLRCKGNELYLADCEKQTGHRAQSCGHRGDISVECNLPQPCDEDDKVSRLKTVQNPKHPSHYDNFVEVKGPYGWGLLCVDSMNVKAASVVCKVNKQLFGNGVRRGNHDYYDGVRYSGKVECVGDEEGMNMCSVFVIKVDVCPQGDAIVDCTPNLPDLVPDLAQFQSSLVSVPYIDQLPMYYLTCALEENCLSSSARGQPYDHYRRLLRFNSQTDNLGTTDFQPVLNSSEWLWHSCHNHWHSFEAFIHYDLLNITTGEKVAEGHKASFCLEDSTCTDGVPNYRCSGTRQQGISKNCGDLYGRYLDCQWIDVTDVPVGTYRLRQHVNPDSLSPESDYRNNIISCDITFYPDTTRFTVTKFQLSDH